MRSCSSPWAGTDLTPEERLEKLKVPQLLCCHTELKWYLIKCALFGCFAALDHFPEPEAMQLHPRESGGWKIRKKMSLEQKAAEMSRSRPQSCHKHGREQSRMKASSTCPLICIQQQGKNPPGARLHEFGITFTAPETSQRLFKALQETKRPFFATCWRYPKA